MIEWISRAWMKVRVSVHKSLNRTLYKQGVIVYGIPKLVHRDKITIGKNSTINENVYLYGRGGIVIEDGVSLSYNVSLISSGYRTSDWMENKKHKHHESDPIKIERDCWIGANTTVLKGITIAEGSIVGAGSVVTKNLTEPNALYAGNPARYIKSLKP